MVDRRGVNVAVSCVLLGLVLSGCAGAPAAAKEWSAVAEVRGTSAVISIEVPGWIMITDYHPHLALDGGPEIMPYSATYVFSNLSPGRHQVRVVIADPGHRPIGGMQKIIDLDVK